MNILHLEDLAGVASSLADIQSRQGHKADVVATWRTSKAQTIKKMAWVWANAKKYDVVHIHGGIPAKRMDLRRVARSHPNVIMHYHGSETRMGYGLIMADTIKKKIVATPDLLAWHPTAVFIRNPMAAMGAVVQPHGYGFRVFHKPTNRSLKGSDIIDKAVSGLGIPGLEYDTPKEMIPKDEFIKRMAQADLVIDQVTPMGLPGVTTLEAMALGIPVLTHISKEMGAYYPGIPAINPDTPTVEDIRYCIHWHHVNRGWERPILARRGREYLAKYHDPAEICDMVRAVYEGGSG